MAKSQKVFEELQDYLAQLKRHVEGRFALHIHISQIEKHLQQSQFRMRASADLRPLVDKHGARIFALPNHDLIVITRETPIDAIEKTLVGLRKSYGDSALVASLNVKPGISDEFTTWFNLEQSYEQLVGYVDTLAAALSSGAPAPKAAAPKASATPSGAKTTSAPSSKARGKKLRYVPIAGPDKKEVNVRPLDPDMLLTITTALTGADVTPYIRRQNVMAIMGAEAPIPVMVHRWVSLKDIYAALLERTDIVADMYLTRYLQSFVLARLFASNPEMSNAGAIASSVRVSAAAVNDDAFDTFDRAVGSTSRSKIILEFSILDVMEDPALYFKARTRARDKGYRISIADVAPFSFLWLDYGELLADFVKIRLPETAQGTYLLERKAAIQQAVKKIGQASVILSGVDHPELLDIAKDIGISLFQGEAVSPSEED